MFSLSVRRLAALRRHGSAFVPCVLALVLGVGVLASLLHFLPPRLLRGLEETSGLFVCVPRAAALGASKSCLPAVQLARLTARLLCSAKRAWASLDVPSLVVARSGRLVLERLCRIRLERNFRNLIFAPTL